MSREDVEFVIRREVESEVKNADSVARLQLCVDKAVQVSPISPAPWPLLLPIYHRFWDVHAKFNHICALEPDLISSSCDPAQAGVIEEQPDVETARELIDEFKVCCWWLDAIQEFYVFESSMRQVESLGSYVFASSSGHTPRGHSHRWNKRWNKSDNDSWTRLLKPSCTMSTRYTDASAADRGCGLISGRCRRKCPGMYRICS